MPSPGAKQPINAVVFDIGNVLLDWDPRHLYRKLFDDPAAMERFLTEVCTLEWHQAHDLGVPFDESCATLAAKHPDQEELIWAWGRRTEEMIAGPIDGTVQLLSELKQAGIGCYALTNMERETFAVRRERYLFFGWFNGIVVSSHEGVAKPDLQAFQRVLERYGLEPPTTLMIDDSAKNIEAAASIGMQAVQFHSPAQLRKLLTEAGLFDRSTVG